MSLLPVIVSSITTLLAFAGCAYYLLALWSARAFLRDSREAPGEFHPGVSILKPVKGLDPGMYASLLTHCEQDYGGEYEIVFAVKPGDASIPEIERLQREQHRTAIKLVLCPERLGANGKVSNLVQAYLHASYDYLVINDSDISVSRSYLRQIMAAFTPGRKQGRSIGMVTALYRGRPAKSLFAKMEAMGIATDFAPSVLTARYLEKGIHFGLGSTLAVSRESLEASGGFLPLIDTLADDYELGARIAAAGYAIHLSREVVETSVPAYNFRQFLDHQLRWARTVRAARPGGYFGIVFSYGLAWAVWNVVACGASIESLALLSIAAAARSAVACLIGGDLLRDRRVFRDMWLVLLRDLISLNLWAWSYASSLVQWRGETFYVEEGKLVAVNKKTRDTAPQA